MFYKISQKMKKSLLSMEKIQNEKKCWKNIIITGMYFNLENFAFL